MLSNINKDNLTKKQENKNMQNSQSYKYGKWKLKARKMPQ